MVGVDSQPMASPAVFQRVLEEALLGTCNYSSVQFMLQKGWITKEQLATMLSRRSLHAALSNALRSWAKLAAVRQERQCHAPKNMQVLAERCSRELMISVFACWRASLQCTIPPSTCIDKATLQCRALACTALQSQTEAIYSKFQRLLKEHDQKMKASKEKAEDVRWRERPVLKHITRMSKRRQAKQDLSVRKVLLRAQMKQASVALFSDTLFSNSQQPDLEGQGKSMSQESLNSSMSTCSTTGSLYSPSGTPPHSGPPLVAPWPTNTHL